MKEMKNLTGPEKLVIELLKKAARHWPDSLWIFAEGGQLHIMRTNEHGEHVTNDQTGGFDSSFLVDSIDIDSDGGGW